MATIPNAMSVGVFDTRAQAEVAIDQLWHAGFDHDDVGMASPGEPARVAHTPDGEMESVAATGAVTGAIAGGAVGAVAGALATAFIPGIGPVVAGGLLVTVLTGGAAGAAIGTFAGPFIAMGFSEKDAEASAHQVRAGHTIVLVRGRDRLEEADRLLTDAGATEVTHHDARMS